MTEFRPGPWRTAAAIGFLHVLAVLPYPWESAPAAVAWLRPSADLALLGSLLAVLGLLGRRPMRWAVPLAVLTCMLPLYRFGSTIMPVYYAKPFEPWVDVLEVWGLAHLLLHGRPVLVQALALAGAALVLVAVLAAAWRAYVVLAVSCTRRGFAVALLVLCQALAVGDWVAAAAGAPLWRASMLRAAARDLVAAWRTGSFFVAEIYEERAARAAAELRATPQDLGALGGADVHVLFLESYGRSVLDGRARATWETWLAEAEAELRAAGRRAVSGWIRPAVRGGRSTVAHVELLSGIRLEDRRMLDRLLERGARCLPRILRENGYTTVQVQPAMPRPWPEARTLGFERQLFRADLPYDGRRYPWGDMPDQYALAFVLDRIVAPANTPVFTMYVSVTSHAPFAMVPPYFEDWSHALEPGAFAGSPAKAYDITWTNYAGHPRLVEAYLETTRYGLRAAIGFAARLPRPSLVFVLGDHQPPLCITDRADRAHDVPLHVIADREDLLAPWRRQGFADGLAPARDRPSFPSERFLFRFLRAYARR